MRYYIQPLYASQRVKRPFERGWGALIHDTLFNFSSFVIEFILFNECKDYNIGASKNVQSLFHLLPKGGKVNGNKI